MGIDVYDHRGECARWLHAYEPAIAFTEWVTQAPPELRAGFSLLPARPGEDRWESVVRTSVDLVDQAPGLADQIEDPAVIAQVDDAVRRVENLLDARDAPVAIHVLVGLGASNACQGYWHGTGLVYVFVEQFLAPHNGVLLLGLGTERIGLWTAHELAHALRYSLPDTASLVPKHAAVEDPFDFSPALERLPLTERFVDEGLATRLSASAYPEAPATDVLHMTTQELHWLENNAARLLDDRRERGSLNRWDPDPEWIAESLHPSRRREEPSLEHPPGRWGYYVGARLLVPPKIGSWDRAVRRQSEAPTEA